MHVHLYSLLRPQMLDTDHQSGEVLFWSEIPTLLAPHISQTQLDSHLGDRNQEFSQMPKVPHSLMTKTKIIGIAVHLYDKQLPVTKPCCSRLREQETHRYIENNTPHHSQPRLWDTVQRLQLVKNRCSHKQGLRESKRILGVENTRRLIKDLLVDPKQRRIPRLIPLELHRERPSSDQSEPIDAVSNLPWQCEERGVG